MDYLKYETFTSINQDGKEVVHLKWLEELKESHGFEFKCRKNCTQPCTECFRRAFGKAQNKKYFYTTVQNVDLDKIPMPIPESFEIRQNVSNNNERSHKFMWISPDKCYQEKCKACRNLSCCNYDGLFVF